MPIPMRCPFCAKPFQANDEYAGRQIRCPYCSSRSIAPFHPSPPSLPSPKGSSHIHGWIGVALAILLLGWITGGIGWSLYFPMLVVLWFIYSGTKRR